METNKVYQGHVLDVLRSFPDECIDCVITSPPYWSLRSYNTEPQIWDAQDGCVHEWRNQICRHCNAWKGELGLEPTFQLYLKHLIEVFREVKRVMKATASCWVNLGDTYGGNNSRASNNGRAGFGTSREGVFQRGISGNLCSIPERFKIMMQDDLDFRHPNVCIWEKPNCMPSSAPKRFTVSHEYFYWFVKGKPYYFERQFEQYDRPINRWGGQSIKADTEKMRAYKDMMNISPSSAMQPGNDLRPNPLGRNRRTVWRIPTKPSSLEHYASFPEDLVIIPILSCCPEFICTKCNLPREKVYNHKVLERYELPESDPRFRPARYDGKYKQGMRYAEDTFQGYTDCGCGEEFRPGIVLDPFCGTGTVLRVAQMLNRSWVGIDLKNQYVEFAENKLGVNEDYASLSLFAGLLEKKVKPDST